MSECALCFIDGRYPYVVSIQSDGSHICEGVLVAANVVLTAAQCVELEPFPFVKIGSRYLSDDDPRSIKEEVKFPVEVWKAHYRSLKLSR